MLRFGKLVRYARIVAHVNPTRPFLSIINDRRSFLYSFCCSEFVCWRWITNKITRMNRYRTDRAKNEFHLSSVQRLLAMTLIHILWCSHLAANEWANPSRIPRITIVWIGANWWTKYVQTSIQWIEIWINSQDTNMDFDMDSSIKKDSMIEYYQFKVFGSPSLVL